jgi:hypothetical protein
LDVAGSVAGYQTYRTIWVAPNESHLRKELVLFLSIDITSGWPWMAIHHHGNLPIRIRGNPLICVTLHKPRTYGCPTKPYHRNQMPQGTSVGEHAERWWLAWEWDAEEEYHTHTWRQPLNRVGLHRSHPSSPWWPTTRRGPGVSQGGQGWAEGELERRAHPLERERKSDFQESGT